MIANPTDVKELARLEIGSPEALRVLGSGNLILEMPQTLLKG
jgi:hypothetical protein